MSRAAQEYLAVLDEAAFGATTPVPPKFISPADPAARWTGAHGGQAFFAYTANYPIDLDHAIIVDVEATTTIRQAEVTAVKRMIERSRERFDHYTAKLAGDSGYGSTEMFGWLVYEQGIEPHISVFDKSARTDGAFSRADFVTQARAAMPPPGGWGPHGASRSVFSNPPGIIVIPAIQPRSPPLSDGLSARLWPIEQEIAGAGETKRA